LTSGLAAAYGPRMERTVVCISASDGSGGEQIGPLVATRLGMQLIDEEIVARAAQEAGVEAHVVAGVEQRRSLIERLLEQLPATAAAAPMSGYVPLAYVEPGPGGDQLRGLIRSAIEEIGDRGSAVIVSHAASLALSRRDGVLRVLVTGSEEERRARLAEARGVDEREAEKLLSRGDANRADYFKRFYKVGAELPTHYDLVINTDRLSLEQAADIIVHAAEGSPDA
jgi:Cytidylate kinase-like family